jgi:hypothetical protein
MATGSSNLHLPRPAAGRVGDEGIGMTELLFKGEWVEVVYHPGFSPGPGSWLNASDPSWSIQVSVNSCLDGEWYNEELTIEEAEEVHRELTSAIANMKSLTAEPPIDQ